MIQPTRVARTDEAGATDELFSLPAVRSGVLCVRIWMTVKLSCIRLTRLKSRDVSFQQKNNF
jgi:hypothetical protein